MDLETLPNSPQMPQAKGGGVIPWYKPFKLDYEVGPWEIHHLPWSDSMIRENRQLVTNKPVEFEKWAVEVQDNRKITDHSRGIYRLYPNLIKENRRRMSTCNRLDLQTLGSQPVMPKNLPNHWSNFMVHGQGFATLK